MMVPLPRWSRALRNRWIEEDDNVWLRSLDGFENLYGAALVWAIDAPGRICVMGEHSDYVPYLSPRIITFASAEQRMRALVSPREDGVIRISSSLDGCESVEFSVSDVHIDGDWLDELNCREKPKAHWSNYVRGAVAHTVGLSNVEYGFDMYVDSDIPPASGTSSSSALTMCALMAINLSNGRSWTKKTISIEGGRSEWFGGMRGGMMDHATMAYAEEGNLLQLDFKPFRVTQLKLGEGSFEWYTVFTRPADKGREAMHSFNQLSSVQHEIGLLLENMDEGGLEWEGLAEKLPETMSVPGYGIVRIRDRYRFVRREQERSFSLPEYIQNGDFKIIGEAMNNTWDDTRNLLGTHTDEIDEISDELREMDEILGVKVMGAGFGGNLLVLAREGSELGDKGIYHSPGGGMDVFDFEDSFAPSIKAAAVILCGGKGSRMVKQGVDIHKPLMEIDGVPALLRVLTQLSVCGVEFDTTVVVVPPQRKEEYEMILDGWNCQVVVQTKALGTGDAVYCALPYIGDDIDAVYVSFGTQPLVRDQTIVESLNYMLDRGLGFVLPTTITNEPYAPLVRDSNGAVSDSVETHLEGAEKPDVGEANVGAYWATIESLNDVLVPLVKQKSTDCGYNTPSGELGYPNEMVRACLSKGVGVDGFPCSEPSEMIGIKRKEDIEVIESVLRQRKRWSRASQSNES